MAEDASLLLEQLREELRASGYEALLLEDDLAHMENARSVEETLGALLAALQAGVVDAMFAHAASIRLLESRPGPHGKLWEPLPTRSGSLDDDPDAIVVPLDVQQADRLEALAGRLDRVISELGAIRADEG